MVTMTSNKDKDDFLAEIPCSLDEYMTFESEEFKEKAFIASLLCNQGYITIRKTGTNVDVNMTPLGIEFHKTGGYAGAQKREKAERWKNRLWSLAASIVAGVVSGWVVSGVTQCSSREKTNSQTQNSSVSQDSISTSVMSR